MREVYLRAAQALAGAGSAIALTGAGASVESGIPDFRSEGGLWERFPPEEFATIEAFQENPDRVWKMWIELGRMLTGAAPNAGHLALAELHRLNRLQAVITQNIDNLHQLAGSKNVIEYHGNASRMICMECGRSTRLDLEDCHGRAPRCPCGGVMKPQVVLFGEQVPLFALMESERLAKSCDVLLVVGTSASVYPAADLPHLAKEAGAFIIECNTTPTDFTNSITDAFLQGPAGTTLPALLGHLRPMLAS